MARIRPKDTELIKKLISLNKAYFTVADLEKIINLKKESLRVTLSRLATSGVLNRVKRNVYRVLTQDFDAERVGSELYFPSYLSFETALAHYGILSQIPVTITFATARPSKKLELGGKEIEYSHLGKELFFGYRLFNGKNMAEAEKALLDELYLLARGKRSLNLAELDLRNLEREKLERYAKKFPRYLDKWLAKIKDYLGTTPITGEIKERVRWRA